jgi:hypothetical protein
MAKIFYTVEEACAKLGKTNDQVVELISSGKLREFRNQGQLMLKVEDVNSLASDAASDSGLDLKLGTGAVNLAGSDSFELDLSDSTTPATAADPKGDSPVGPAAHAGITDDAPLALDSMSSAVSPAPAAKSEPAGDELALELELEASGAGASPAAASKAPAGASGSSSGITMPPADDDSVTLELDLSDSAPAAPAAAAPAKSKPNAASSADSEALFLEDSLASGIAASPAKSAAPNQTTDFDQTIEESHGSASFDSIGSVAGASGSLEADKINLDQPGSGSGLLDLTQESEDSQMGAALMDEAFQGDDDEAPKNASGIFGGAAGESGVNEAAAVGAAVAGAGAAAVPAFAGAAMSTPEVYSGAWSGLTVGLLVPVIVGLTATAAMLVVKTLGGTPELAVMFASDWMVWAGGFAGAVAVCGGIGFFVGKATE